MKFGNSQGVSGNRRLNPLQEVGVMKSIAITEADVVVS